MISDTMEPHEVYERMMADADNAYDGADCQCIDCTKIRVPNPEYNDSYARFLAGRIGGNDGKTVEIAILSEHESTALACSWCAEMDDFVDARDDVDECDFFVPKAW